MRVPVTRIFPDAVVPVVIPLADVTPNVAPDDNVNEPPPETVVPSAAIWRMVPLFTVKFIVFDIVPPDV